MSPFVCLSTTEPELLSPAVLVDMGLESPQELHGNARHIAEAAAGVCHSRGGTLARLPFCNTLEAESLGASVRLSAQGAFVPQQPYASAQELPKSLPIASPRIDAMMQAVSILRRDLGAPVRMESLARQVGMSLSTLHRHFKTVTGLSPLQYLKQLRLHEAQRLMLMEDMRAASAALSVGYESVTQFSREYKRMFGEPPHRDIQRKRTLAPLGEAGAGGL